MKFYKLILSVGAIIFSIQAFVLLSFFYEKPNAEISPQQQRPPLTVNPDEECHIIDAVPLLAKKNYKSGVYKMTESNGKPLIVFETFKAGKLLDLKIEQRGCEDIYAKFDFIFKEKRDRGIKANLNKAALILKNLKINPDALIDSKTVSQIADAAISESKKAKPSKKKLVCLSKIQSECLSDVSLEYDYPNLRLFYVDRP